MKPTIYLDMDGVLTDFVGAVAKLFKYKGDIYKDWRHLLNENKVGDPYSIEGVLDITSKQLWDVIDSIGPSFWMMRYYPWAMELYKMLKGYGEVVILSSPSMSVNSWLGKVHSLQMFFGSTFRDFILCPAPHKTKLANKNSILIDDAERNINNFVNAGGHGIIFPQPWNYVPKISDGNKIRYIEKTLTVNKSILFNQT